MEVRGYPSLLFFPAQADLPEGTSPKAYKFQGPRNIEAFEDFTLKGGWKHAKDDSQVPMNLSTIESYGRWFA